MHARQVIWRHGYLSLPHRFEFNRTQGWKNARDPLTGPSLRQTVVRCAMDFYPAANDQSIESIATNVKHGFAGIPQALLPRQYRRDFVQEQFGGQLKIINYRERALEPWPQFIFVGIGPQEVVS